MRRTLRFGHALWLCAALPLAAPAAETNGITARAGTLGYGVEFGLGLSANTQVRFGANSASRSSSGNEGGVEYDMDVNLRSGDVLLDWHPFDGVFFTSIGALYNKNEIEVRSKSTGSVTVGGNTYTNPSLTGEVTFNKFAPYLGLGWGSSPAAKGFVWKFDLGVAYQGSPEVKLRSTSNTTVVNQTDLDREAAEMEESLKDYKYYPHVGFSLGMRF